MSSKTYVARESSLTWSDTAGGQGLTLNNLAAGALRLGEQADFGVGSTPEWFTWRLTVQFETAPVVGETVPIYMSWSDGVHEDGELGAADAAADANSIKNMKQIGVLIVTSTDAAHDMTASGICRIPTQYASPCIYNKTADNLKAANDVSEFTLTPIPPESQ